MAAFCRSCGSSLSAGKFCTTCGAATAATPLAEAAPIPRPSAALRCVECGSDIRSGLVCARCTSRPQVVVRRPSSASLAPPLAQPSDGLHASGGPGARNLWVGILAWALVAIAALLWMNYRSGGRLVGQLPGFGASVDGRYVSSEFGWPMTVQIDGDTGSLDYGRLRGSMMRVERHGDTVTFSGGVVADLQGRVVSAKEWQATTGGRRRGPLPDRRRRPISPSRYGRQERQVCQAAALKPGRAAACLVSGKLCPRCRRRLFGGLSHRSNG